MRHLIINSASATMVAGRRRRDDLRVIRPSNYNPTTAQSASIIAHQLLLLLLLTQQLLSPIDAQQIPNYGQAADAGFEGAQCGFPGEPIDGTTTPIKPDYETRDTVTFSCHSGYILVGPHQITCRKDSTWSGDAPQCLKEAAEIEGAVLSDDNVNTCVEVTNNRPLKLRTSPFSQHSIKAIVISLSKVTGSPNVEITVSNDGANSQSCVIVHNVLLQDSNLYHNFNCNNIVTGNTVQIAVKSMKVFSPTASVTVCEVGVADAYVVKRKCGSPQIPANGSIKNRTEDRVTYRCFRGFYVQASATSECENGVWKNQVQCRKVAMKCGFPGLPKNGFHEYADSITGTVRYACLPSYMLVGPSIRACLLNGTWSPQTIPKCLTNVAYGKYVSHSDMSSGANKPSVDENPETCDVIGYHRADLTQQRWWKLDFGSLKPISSVRVVQPRGQQKRLKVASFTSDVAPRTNIPCVTPNVNQGSGLLVCELRAPASARGIYIQPDDRQGNITLCEVQVVYMDEQVLCETVDEQLNSKVTYKQNNALFACDAGYSLSGPRDVICENGSWKPPYPTCTVAGGWKPGVPTPMPRTPTTGRPTSSSSSGEHHEAEDKKDFIFGIMGIAIGVTAASVSIIIAIVVIVCVMKRHYRKKHSCSHHDDCSPGCSAQHTNSTTYNNRSITGSSGHGSHRDWDESSIHLYETVKPEYDTLPACDQSLVVNESYVLTPQKSSLNRNPMNMMMMMRPRLAPPRSNHIYDSVAAEESLLDRDGRPRENGHVSNGATMPPTTTFSRRDDVAIIGQNLPRTDL